MVVRSPVTPSILRKSVALMSSVFAACIARAAMAQALGPYDNPNDPYSPPEEPPSEPIHRSEGPGWNPQEGEKKEEEPEPHPAQYRIAEHERPGDRFGEPGQFVVTTDFGIGISSARWDSSDASAFGLTLFPALEYFIVRDVSVGIEADFSTSTSKGSGADGSLVERHSELVGGGAHLGVNLRFSRLFSLYPRLAGRTSAQRRRPSACRSSPAASGVELSRRKTRARSKRRNVGSETKAPSRSWVNPSRWVGLGTRDQTHRRNRSRSRLVSTGSSWTTSPWEVP
jgi:hypothetical protein